MTEHIWIVESGYLSYKHDNQYKKENLSEHKVNALQMNGTLVKCPETNI